MKRALTTFAIVFVGFVAFGQQDMQFSQNMFNKLSVNPGFAGTNKALCGTALYRTQWVAFPGQPKQAQLSVDGFFEPLFGGVGLTIASDQLGNDRSFLARAAYSYHKTIGGVGVLGIGLEVGIMQKRLLFNWQASDGIQFDDVIPKQTASSMTYDLGFGAYYTTDKLYVGISSSHLPEQNITDKDLPEALDYNFGVARHYYLMAGYNWDMNPDFTLKPGVLVKTDATSTQLDVNLLVEYQKMIWAGASYRLTDAIVAMIGYRYELNPKTELKIGYSFDLTTSQLKNYSNNTHEIMLGFCHKLKQPSKVHRHQNTRDMH